MNIAQGGDSIEIKAVFDGSHQWVETRGSSRVEVLKISLSELVNSQRPFDTSYYLMGSGLLNGEDFPASLFTLLATYEFKAVCERGIVTLSGTLDEEEFAKYALTKRSQASVESRVRQYSERFSQLVMEFDQLSLGIKGYELGAVGERAIFRVDFKNLQVNEKLPVNHFFYRAPKDVKVVDITEELLLRLRSAE
ncbi:MAG: hypothetical protein COB04_06985 [Gammaproteobacteria bacterium]|nr:MAG: hypothetical protein COB04_06985 [Gammaproteobacteria bacterium]